MQSSPIELIGSLSSSIQDVKEMALQFLVC